MEKGSHLSHAITGRRTRSGLWRDDSGSTIVEAAIALPLMITLLLGAISYGMWFMAAHSLQQAANDGARAALAALDQAERDEIVADAVSTGVLDAGTVNPSLVEVETSLDSNLFTVRLSYDASQGVLLSNPIVPMPSSTIVRSASVRLSSF